MAARYDLVIVGMGTAGIVAAELASALDLRIAVVERDRIGGDCLWTGCVPSKALIASARAAHTMRNADALGLAPVEPAIDTAKVLDRIRAVQQEIADAEDNPERFEALGIEVLMGESARLAGPHAVEVGGRTLEARYVLVATGSRPAVPPIEGLADAGFLDSETVWDLERAPASVIFVGGGPTSIELAQAFGRLGVAVTLLERRDRILDADEPELAERVAGVLRDGGVDLRLGAEVEAVAIEDGRKVVAGSESGEPRRWTADALFVGTGRRPNVDGLGLEALGIEVEPHCVVVDARSRTRVPSIYAVGDVAGRRLFTHTAGYEAALAVRDMFFPGRGKVQDAAVWCTFTDPELAHAGLTAGEAECRFGAGAVDVWRQDLAHNDRARADVATTGAIVVVTRRGRIVGAHVLAPHAGETIQELALAIREGMKLTDVASLLHVYPTTATAVGELAAEAAFADARRYKWLVRRTKA
jgi:pyruvate/2-oxoglutarate dehydrogenase complex dihydrolipoamide dehydrogenase (E3) component